MAVPAGTAAFRGRESYRLKEKRKAGLLTRSEPHVAEALAVEEPS